MELGIRLSSWRRIHRFGHRSSVAKPIDMVDQSGFLIFGLASSKSAALFAIASS
jgi:hypothetical protein